MISKFRYLFPSLAVMALVGAAATATQSTAFAADSMPASDKAAGHNPVDRADERIKQLHTDLKITPDQESKFGALADVMRENAKDMSGEVEKTDAAKKTAGALDDLKAYQERVQVHADGLKKLVPAFEALYSVLTDDQKKDADQMFAHTGEHKRGHKS